jgi:hypothetical protein
MGDCFGAIWAARLTGWCWLVAGIDLIHRSVRCVSYCGRPHVKGRSESVSCLSGPEAIRL